MEHTVETFELIGELYPRKRCDYTICSKIYELYKSQCMVNKTQKCDKIYSELEKCRREWAQCRRTSYSSYF